MTMGNIIINADDFGRTSSINKAIIELFDQKLINSTTLMANMPGFEEAIELSHQHKITHQIGAHLVLTDGEPLTKEIRSIPYLFNHQTNSRKVYIRNFFHLNKTHKDLIFKEYAKQIEKIRSNGVEINHLDTHHQIHDMAGIFRIIVELLRTYNIRSMRILNNLDITEGYKMHYRHLLNRYLKIKKINYSDYLGSRVDFLLAFNRNPDFIKNKSVEIMVHPTYNSGGQLIDIFEKKEYDFEYLKDMKTNLGHR